MKKLIAIISSLFFITIILISGCSKIETKEMKVTVTIDSTGYNPKTIVVHPPTKVTWINKDVVAHTVASGEPEYIKFDSGKLEPGAKFQLEFTEEMIGEYEYHSYINGDEELGGDVIVQE